MKKIIKTVLLLSAIIFCSLNANNIIAYFSDAETKINKLTIGSVKIEILEDFQPPINLTPNMQFKKDVQVTNIGEANCYIRIKAVYTDSVMGDHYSLNIDTENFVYNTEDNFYYYVHELSVGETTPSLFTTVTIDNTITQEQIKNFDILIYAESYESSHFSTYQEAWLHYQRNKPLN
jgi:hypothetical protein